MNIAVIEVATACRDASKSCNMKAVMPEVPPDILAWRERTGANRWDEVWEGVLHMSPAPNREHQDLLSMLEYWLRTHWAAPGARRVHRDVNVAAADDWRHDFRIPDLVLLCEDRFQLDRGEYLAGGPNVVVEIRSPNDESHEKLNFYASIGCSEVWIIDRDTRRPQLFLVSGGESRAIEPDAQGWLASGASGIEFRAAGEDELEIRLNLRPETAVLLPHEV